MDGVGVVCRMSTIVGIRSCADAVDLDFIPFLVLAEYNWEVVGVDDWGNYVGDLSKLCGGLVCTG